MESYKIVIPGRSHLQLFALLHKRRLFVCSFNNGNMLWVFWGKNLTKNCFTALQIAHYFQLIYFSLGLGWINSQTTSSIRLVGNSHSYRTFSTWLWLCLFTIHTYLTVVGIGLRVNSCSYIHTGDERWWPMVWKESPQSHLV